MTEFESKLAKYLKDILPTVNAQFVNMDWLAGKITTFIDQEARDMSCRRLYEKYSNCCKKLGI